MKKYVKDLSQFISEDLAPMTPVAHTVTGAKSNDEIVPLQVQDPVHSFGVWNQTFAGSNRSNSTYADQLIAQAALYGMTPEEYLQTYGRTTGNAE